MTAHVRPTSPARRARPGPAAARTRRRLCPAGDTGSVPPASPTPSRRRRRLRPAGDTDSSRRRRRVHSDSAPPGPDSARPGPARLARPARLRLRARLGPDFDGSGHSAPSDVVVSACRPHFWTRRLAHRVSLGREVPRCAALPAEHPIGRVRRAIRIRSGRPPRLRTPERHFAPCMPGAKCTVGVRGGLGVTGWGAKCLGRLAGWGARAGWWGASRLGPTEFGARWGRAGWMGCEVASGRPGGGARWSWARPASSRRST